jgi:hypothetical protein
MSAAVPHGSAISSMRVFMSKNGAVWEEKTQVLVSPKRRSSCPREKSAPGHTHAYNIKKNKKNITLFQKNQRYMISNDALYHNEMLRLFNCDPLETQASQPRPRFVTIRCQQPSNSLQNDHLKIVLVSGRLFQWEIVTDSNYYLLKRKLYRSDYLKASEMIQNYHLFNSNLHFRGNNESSEWRAQHFLS